MKNLLDQIVANFKNYEHDKNLQKAMPGLLQLTSIVSGRLYFGVCTQEYRDYYKETEPETLSCVPVFDSDIPYHAFNFDFGPHNLANIVKFRSRIISKMATNTLPVVHLSGQGMTERLNSAFLMGCYAISKLNMSAYTVMEKLRKNIPSPYGSYRDASWGSSDFPLELYDCLKAIQKGIKLGFIDLDTFDWKEYLHYDMVENGDLNWIIPNKILAFCGPIGNETYHFVPYLHHPPHAYFDYFKKNNITTIVRLNSKAYDAKQFVKAGFVHEDLYFEDGSCPTYEIVDKFLEICERSNGAIAVHCKAGLGRTGTLIGCYMMKHYHFTAQETIAWIRICRPGSVLGAQQEYLVHMQPHIWALGRMMRKQKTKDTLVEKKSPHDVRTSLRRKNQNKSTKTDEGRENSSSSDDDSGLLLLTNEVQKISINVLQRGKSEEERMEAKQITQGDRLNRIKHLRASGITEVTNLISDNRSTHSTHRHPYNTRSCSKVDCIPTQSAEDATSPPKSTRSTRGNSLSPSVIPMSRCNSRVGSGSIAKSKR
ncbi:dual specificity protein phosphatase CDC14C-like isoform X2 [Brevipalpus obovatus]|uniref:dual specificity protein phosphatase CDC14C-like isoform X2 n=1 Tax=Brevipalpus obovatus TaxID=246614 RepID=UPI003D9FAF61